MTAAAQRTGDLRNYVLVTGAYWADTVADGAIRLLVLFYFYELGYSPLAVASLFLFYELFGIITNLVGGFAAARFGLKTTLFAGLGVQVVALLMLGLAPESLLVVPYVMASQALSGIAKDLTKMSSKSAVKLAAPAIKDRQNAVRAKIKSAAGDVTLFVHPQRAPYTHKGLATVQTKQGSTYQEAETEFQHITTAVGYMVDHDFPLGIPPSSVTQLRV